MTAAFSQTGGARLGMLNASWPFATLSATPEILCLSCFDRDYRFPKNSIRSLSRYRFLFSSGLRIEHTDSSFPHLIVFWPSGFRKLKAQLEGLGYEIRD